MESAYDPKKYEPEMFRFWERRGDFKLPEKIGKKKFVVIMAPPNVTGSLHLGHALENTMLDVLVRFKRQKGAQTIWIPGTDHAGIATQNVVEKELKKEGKRKEDLGREKFIERVWQWREKYGNIILEQFKKLGILANWSEARFTLDKEYAEEVLKAFVAYYKKGWIYRGKRVVNWCPRCRTSLSDLEVEYKEEKGKLWYIRYPLKSDPKNPNASELSEKQKIVEKALSYKLNGIFFEVQKELGRFCRERQYADALAKKLENHGLRFKRETPIEVAGRKSNFADFIVEDKVLIELKTLPFIKKEDYYQVLRYLEAAHLELGLLVNFRQKYLKPKRVLNSKLQTKDAFGSFGLNSDDSDRYIVVATTRPETMLGDAAVAVNPKDKRYKNLIGGMAILPLVKREIPVIADDAVEQKFGTGAVKVTPAHSIVDAEIAKRSRLPMFEVIDEGGRIQNVPQYNGLKILEAREKVLEDLKNQNLIEKEEEYVHSVGHCYRCGAVLENLPSLQWFLNMERLAKLATDAVKKGKTNILPKRWEKPYFDWLKNIRDWCISRQLWWGHQVPVWLHDSKCVQKSGHGSKDFDKCEETVVSVKKPSCNYCDAEYIRSQDVLDTWFSSALWPFATLYTSAQRKNFYPADLMSSAPEILHLWITRMIFSGMFFMKKEPFKTAYIHATVLTKEGKRMSKSLGTGIDPLDLIEKYSADALRFALMWQLRGTQAIRFDPAGLEAGKKFANKIWNASRYVAARTQRNAENNAEQRGKIISANQRHNQRISASMIAEDKKILKELGQVEKEVEKDILNFRMGQALERVYRFFWHSFCDAYLEATKKRDDAASRKILNLVLERSLALISLFMPFVSEALRLNLKKTQ